jgi:hypothetical protein
MDSRKQFTFYRSFYEAVNVLPREIRLDVFEAIMKYALDKIEPEGLNCYQTSSFMLVRPILDSAWEKAEAGQKGGSTPKANRKQNESKGEEEKKKEKEKKKENETEDKCHGARFEDFWKLYPVKLGKDNAREVWERLDPDGQAVCDGVRKWLQTEQWREKDGRFIPRASKFLEEEHYRQLPAGHIPPGASGTLGMAELEAIERIMKT